MDPRRLADLWAPGGARTRGASFASAALAPAEIAFRLGVLAREGLLRSRILRARRAPIPVISVGGLEAGGTGKTPLACVLVQLAVRAGFKPAVLSRGHGGRSLGSRRGPLAVRHVPDRPAEEDAWIYGDEPVWLASRVARAGGSGVWIAPQRIDAARAAAAAGADLAILDDGFQHRGLARAGDVVTLNGAAPLANGRLLPRGPLREGPEALRRADVVVLADAEAREAEVAASALRRWLRSGVPILSWRGERELQPVQGESPAPGEAVVLVAGIAHPERLPAALSRLGVPVAAARFFPDHHRFRREELRAVVTTIAGGERPRCLVTTEKDWPRLRPALPAGARVALLAQRICWNEPGAEAGWLEWLRGVCGR